MLSGVYLDKMFDIGIAQSRREAFHTLGAVFHNVELKASTIVLSLYEISDVRMMNIISNIPETILQLENYDIVKIDVILMNLLLEIFDNYNLLKAIGEI